MLYVSGFDARDATIVAGAISQLRRLFTPIMIPSKSAIGTAALAALCAIAAVPARAQATLSAEDPARSSSARKSTGKGELPVLPQMGRLRRHGTAALRYRCARHASTRAAYRSHKVWRPATGMPYHDQFSYTDKRCYDLTKADSAERAAMANFSRSARSMPWSRYLFARVVGRGESTYEDCVDFWARRRGSASR